MRPVLVCLLPPRSIKCRLKTKSLNLLLSLASYQGASSLAPQSAHPSSKKRRPQQNRAPKRMRGPHSLILRSPHQEQRSPQADLPLPLRGFSPFGGSRGLQAPETRPSARRASAPEVEGSGFCAVNSARTWVPHPSLAWVGSHQPQRTSLVSGR